jgi:hypothetical protein
MLLCWLDVLAAVIPPVTKTYWPSVAATATIIITTIA